MALKKQQIHLSSLWSLDPKRKNSNQVTLKMKGYNSKGTLVEITAIVDNYEFTNMHSQLIDIADENIRVASDFRKNLLSD